MTTQQLSLVILGSYTAVIVVLALLDVRRTSSEEFTIARRNVGWFPLMASVVGNLRDGAGIAAWVVLGIYFGYGALWLTFGLCVGLVVLAGIASKLRATAASHDYFTANQLLRDRFGSGTDRVATAIIAVSALLYAATQVHVASRIFGGLLGTPTFVSVLITTVIVGTYLAIGGFATSVRTGVFQWFVILLIVLIPWLVARGAPSISVGSLTSPGATMAFGFAAISFLVTVSSTDLWQLIFSSRSERQARSGLLVSAPVYIVISIGMVLFAGSVRSAVGQNVEPGNAFFALFSSTTIPSIALAVVGVFVAAAVMSSLDSQVFLFCSSLASIARGSATTSQRTTHSLRLLIIGTMIVLAAVAATIIDLVEFLFGAVTLATILAPVLLYATWKGHRRISDTGTAIAMVVTVVVYAILFATGKFENLLWTIVPALVMSVFVAVLHVVGPRAEALQPTQR